MAELYYDGTLNVSDLFDIVPLDEIATDAELDRLDEWDAVNDLLRSIA